MNFKVALSSVKDNPVLLAVAALVVLILLYLLLLGTRSFINQFQSDGDSPLSRQEIRDFQNTQDAQTTNQVTQNRRQVKRQKDIKESQITGAWDATLDQGGRALLQLKEGTFRLIIVERDAINIRFYMNGSYTLEEDILTFKPDSRSPPPSDKFDYRMLTRSNMPVMIGKYRGRMVWQRPPPEANIYVPNQHAILSRVPNEIAVWNILK